jgi:hypothetical protein
MNAESESVGTCTRTEIADGCSMIWEGGTSNKLGEAIGSAQETLDQAFGSTDLKSLSVPSLTDEKSQDGPSQVALHNLWSVQPRNYGPGIINSFLAVAGGAFKLADKGGWGQGFIDFKYKLAEHGLASLRGQQHPIEETLGPVSFRLSKGCFKASLIQKRTTVLVKTRFADVHECQ